MSSTNVNSLVGLSVSLLPVIAFLVVLIMLDSFKLVRFRAVLYAILLGCLMAVASLWLNTWLIGQLKLSILFYQRYAAPLVEETLKATFLVYLIRRKRVGFMVDAAIFGFSIGTGFALVENTTLFKLWPDPNPLHWIIRGFGTAVMHGMATAIMGIVSKQFSDRYSGKLHVFVPGLAAAFLIHSSYNHFFLSPIVSPIVMLTVLPIVIVVVFRASENATREWLGVRFDTDAELLDMIRNGRVTESRVGAYLQSLQSRFPGEVVADMLCMLRLHLELSIRAKGMLLMREVGFKVPRDPEVEESFRELKFLEKSIGKTGMLAIKPIFNYRDHDLWQLHMIGKQG